jgi:hypothetical protein
VAVGRAYAGILGPVALVTVLAREWFSGGGASTKLFHAWLALVAFSALGGIIGYLAGRLVDDSVGAQISAEMANLDVKSDESSNTKDPQRNTSSPAR